MSRTLLLAVVALSGACGDNEAATRDAAIDAPTDAGLDRIAQAAYIKASNADAEDEFARVALSADGTTMAVGAWLEDSAAQGIGGEQTDNSATDSGAVYIFVRSEGAWVQQAYLKAGNATTRDHFGLTLSLSGDGNTLAVAAPWTSGGAGAVLLFQRNGSVWAQEAHLGSPAPVANGNFGTANDLYGNGVALSADGKTLAVGQTGDFGEVFVFVRSGTTWVRQATLVQTTTGTQKFGDSVAISADGNILAVGAPYDETVVPIPNGEQHYLTGSVYVFERAATTWTEKAKLRPALGHGGYFGRYQAMSSDGSLLAICAQAEASGATGIDGDATDASAPGSGAAFMFARDSTGAWVQQSYIKASNTRSNAQFCVSDALSADGNVLVVGSPQESSAARGIDSSQTDTSAFAAGAAYIFARQGSTWRQVRYIKASNTDAGDWFGWSTAASHDGLVMMVGARRESSAARTIGGDETDNSASGAGAVYGFEPR